MRLQDVMTPDVRTVPASTPTEDAWSQMKLYGIHHLVVRDGRRIVGVLSARDKIKAADRPRSAGTVVRDLMTAPAVTADRTMTVRRAANTMRGRSIGCLVVMQDDRPIGIVTISDLLELVGKGIEQGAQPASRRILSHRVPHRKVHSARGMW